ncbi:hypothetical protein SAMN05216312_108170 [Cohnella sp. OV330]|uniref:hypothetical protein n=1 Tax=Cohnella sp. OV330 TaxID=1855288 RepID=UPI0008F2A5D1|nr:hypothetical protein [Cohnella sp. OV330]SFB44547.1 hypothetical protein SAMN05216312_108170 [Cohnella sp. OV330]
MKQRVESGAAKDSFPSFAVQDEIVLTAVQVQQVEPTDEIRIGIEIGWDNSGVWDMGELEIMLRKGGPDGEVVEWSLESCFASALTKLTYKAVGGERSQTFYLTVRSPHGRAVIRGPYWLKASVRDVR